MHGADARPAASKTAVSLTPSPSKLQQSPAIGSMDIVPIVRLGLLLAPLNQLNWPPKPMRQHFAALLPFPFLHSGNHDSKSKKLHSQLVLSFSFDVKTVSRPPLVS